MIFNEERKIERKKEREKPLGSVRLVYSRTSLPAIFLFSIPFALQLLSISPLGCGLANYTKEANKFENSDCVFFAFSAL